MNAIQYAKLSTRTFRVQSQDGDHYYDQTDTIHNFQTLDPLNPVLSENDLERAHRLVKGEATRYSISKGIGGCNVSVSLTRI